MMLLYDAGAILGRHWRWRRFEALFDGAIATRFKCGLLGLCLGTSALMLNDCHAAPDESHWRHRRAAVTSFQVFILRRFERL